VTDQPPSIETELLSSLELLLIERDVLAVELLDTLSEKEDAAKQIRALRAIVIYLGRIGLVSELLSPFVSLIGHIQKEFEKRKGQRGNLKPLIQAERHAACAAAVDYLNNHAAVPLRDALSLVAGLTDLNAKQLDDLRKNVRTGRGRPEASAYYDSWMKNIRPLFDQLSPTVRKRAVLTSIAKIMDRTDQPI
jgi:hypothetical protein